MSGWHSFNQPESTDTIAAGEVDTLLLSLIEKNLVVRDENSDRYRLLDTIREYGHGCLEALGESGALRNLHLNHFLVLAEGAEPHLTGANHQVWLERLETEHDNLRSALEWSSERADYPEHSLRLAGAIWRFWEVRGHLAEGREKLRTVLAMKGSGRTRLRAKSFSAAGNLAYRQADYVAAQSLHEESLAIRRELGDRQGIAASLGNLGIVTNELGNYRAARTLHEEGLAIWRELGDRRGIAASLGNLGLVTQALGDYAAAQVLHEESLTIWRELCDRLGIANTLANLGYLAHEKVDYPHARTLYHESLAVFRDLGDRWGIAAALGGLATLAAAQGRFTLAACLCGAVERLREDIGVPIQANEQARYERQVAAARAACNDDAAFDLAWQKGRAMTMEQAIALALENPS